VYDLNKVSGILIQVSKQYSVILHRTICGVRIIQFTTQSWYT